MSVPDTGSEIIIALARISRQLEELPARIGTRIAAELQRQAPKLEAQDLAALARLLPPIVEKHAEANFTVGDLLAEAPNSDALHSALRDCFGNLGHAAKRIGKFLHRADGFEGCGVRLERVGKVRDGILWRLARL